MAERFRHGRVFLAGDSAHVMPPNGGFGGNTGVQDAHNLAWKLALVLAGAAGDSLLATYESERRPAAAFTMEQAYARYVTRAAPYLGTEGLQPVVDDLNVELGYRYRSEAVRADAEAEREDAAPHGSPRKAGGRPGMRAPHVWLERNGERMSTLDLFAGRYTLLAGAAGADWCDAARLAATRLGLTVDVHRLGADGLTGEVTGAFGITPTGAALVRPDGFVGWRAKALREDPAGTLTRELESLTGRR